MTTEKTTARELRELSRIEMRDEIETIVLHEFKQILLMSDDEELPFEISYFDLGLTSLRLTEIREKLEMRLDLAINANVLFNEPTVERLVDYLTDTVEASAAAASGAA